MLSGSLLWFLLSSLIPQGSKLGLMSKLEGTMESRLDPNVSNHQATAEGAVVDAIADHNFEFAFNCPNFSDRVLRIEVMGEPSDDKVGIEQSDDDITAKALAPESAKCTSKLLSNCETNAEEHRRSVNIDEGDKAMLEDSTSSEHQAGDDDSYLILRVNSIHISSAILAAKSPFFYKLFSNGMKESHQRHSTLRIDTSEEAALMELLGFMYSGKLSATSPTLLVDVMMSADKYEVASCVSHCIKVLGSLPMTTESALLYLDLPSYVPMASAVVQPLVDVAKVYLSDKYRDITRFQDDLMSLPLAGIEAVLSSDGLQVASEDEVFDFTLKWARARYPVPEERRRILGTHLIHHIRLPYMSHTKLKKVLDCNDLDHELASKLVVETLLRDDSTQKRFAERAYRDVRFRVVRFDAPHPTCVVYFDLGRERCAKLFPSGGIYSHILQLGGQGFFLSAHCYGNQQGSFHSFGLSIRMSENSSRDGSTIDYEFAARIGPSREFLRRYTDSFTSTPGMTRGCSNLFDVPWTSFISDDLIFFIDDTLHLRVVLTIWPPFWPSSLQ